MQRREELQRVPQFLAPLAQVVQGLGGRVRGDRRAAPGDLGEGHPGALGGERAGGPPAARLRLPGTDRGCFSAPGLPSLTAVSLARQPRVSVGEPRRAQARARSAELLAPPLLQVGAERLKVVRLRRAEAARRLLEVEQVHVQVPGRRRQVADPLELGGEERELARSARPRPGARHRRASARCGSAARDPQVVQELGVDVGQHAGDVRLDRVEQAEQDVAAAAAAGMPAVISRRPCSSSRRAGGRGRAARRRTAGRSAGRDAGNRGDQPGGAAGLARIAADLGDRQPGGQPVTCGPDRWPAERPAAR